MSLYAGLQELRQSVESARSQGGDEAARQVECQQLGISLGMLSGAIQGAVIGTAIVPGIGTTIGYVAGALAGIKMSDDKTPADNIRSAFGLAKSAIAVTGMIRSE